MSTDADKEIWRDVKGYEDYYQVSNLGRVKSLKRTIISKDNKKYHYKEKILKHGYAGKKPFLYAIVSFSKNSICKKYKVHQLVAVLFLNHKIKGLSKVVDHKDGDTKNNKLSNLQIVTNRFNSSKDKKNKTSKYTGVIWKKKNNKWKATIFINGKNKHLGNFIKEKDASIEYKRALKEFEKTGKITISTPATRKKSSKYKGVSFDKRTNKWRSFFQHKGKRKFLGYFSDEKNAYNCYLKHRKACGLDA